MKRKGWKYYVSSVMLSVVVVIIMLAIVGHFATPNNVIDGVDWVAYNDSINNRNLEFSKQNPHGFTDRARSIEKDSNVYRIAVLGDSFIWGDGIPYEEVWSHKLENHILAKYDSVEVMHWGRNGWNTRDEYDFYVAEGQKYQPDLLIVGFVNNDPDINGELKFQLEQSWLSQNIPFFGWVDVVLRDNKYHNVEAALFEEPNISRYKGVLFKFDSIAAANNTQMVMIVTANKANSKQKKQTKIIIELLDTVGIAYLNLQPMLINRFGDDASDDVLEASPVNGHPGPALTTMFADSTFKWLQDEQYLSGLPLKRDFVNP